LRNILNQYDGYWDLDVPVSYPMGAFARFYDFRFFVFFGLRTENRANCPVLV